MEKFWKMLGVFTALGLLAGFEAFILKLYWDWFVIPIFNLNPITILQGFGLMLFVHLFREKKPNKFDKVNWSKVLYFKLSILITALSVGYLVSLFL